MAERREPRVRGLGGVFAALGIAAAAHAGHLPAWVISFLVVIGAWRWFADRRGWPLPPRWLRTTKPCVLTC